MRKEITIKVDRVRLAGWFYRPEGRGPFPVIVMSHGLGAVKEMGLDQFAERFSQAGLACLVYDHRNCGGSEGEPRFEFDPWQQINDMRDVVTYAQSLPDVDADRVGLWGTSWSGGHVFVVAATDRRIKCVVAQAPTISGYRNTIRAIPADKYSAFLQEIYQERRARANGSAPTVVRISAEGSDGDAWSRVAGQGTPYKNAMTLLSRELRMAYEPGVYVPRIAPTPLLMVLAKHDVRCPIDDQLAAYQQACEPKQLVLIDGGHYSPYVDKLPEAATAARDWFVKHLVHRTENA
jgi:pimeloyl-ACP methyl ester carboxylesterase